MALEVVYGAGLEALARAFSDRRRALLAAGLSPIVPVPLVVDRRVVGAWLKSALAFADGIAANLSFSSLPAFARALAETSKIPTLLVDHSAWLAALLAVLRDETRLGDPTLEPVRAYLFAAGRSPDLVEVRRHQLAREVSRLVDLYSWWRPDLYARLVDPKGPPLEATGTERWVAALVRGADERISLVAKETGRSRVLLARLHTALKGLELPPDLHVFAPARLAPLALSLLEQLSRSTAVFIYALNPTRIFWEDRAEAVGLPLERWAGERRELVRALNELSRHSATDLERPLAEPESLLERAQEAVSEGQSSAAPALELLLGEGAPPGEVLSEAIAPASAPDPSITFLSCPSVRREVEAVAQEIWRMVEESARADAPEDRLRFSDFAVFAASDAPEVLLHVEAVFKETHQIPHAIIDGPIEGDSAIYGAVELLLSLPLGALRRREVLRFLTHPLVLAPYPDVEPEEWVHWCENTAILWGADQSDHAGSYVDRDMYSWDQGLRRLALGVFMEGGAVYQRGASSESEGAASPNTYFAEAVPFGRVDSAGRFILLARSLIADLRFIRSGVRTAEEWAEILARLVSTYLTPVSDADGRVHRRIERAITDLLGMAPLAGRLPYRAVYEVLMERLRGLSTSAPLGEGVAVGPLTSLAELPFRVVFLVGLGSDRFLEGRSESPLDLRGDVPRPSDLYPDDRQRQAYFSAIFAAKERVVLSWVGRDALTGEPIEPSPVVLELALWLAASGAGAPLRVEVGTDRFSAVVPATKEAPSVVLLGAKDEARASALLDRFRAAAGRAPTLAEIRSSTRDWSREAQAGVERALGIPEIRGPLEVAPQSTVRISELRDFLLDPVQGSARFLLGRARREQDGDLFYRDEEVLSSRPSGRSNHLVGAILAAIAEAEPIARVPFLLDAHYQALAAAREQENARPIGVFAEVERAADGQILRQAWAQMTPLVPSRGALRPLVLGRPDSTPGQVERPLAVPVRGAAGERVIEVVGRTEPVVDAPAAMVLLGVRGGTELRLSAYEAVRAIVDHIVLAASGREAREGRAALFLLASKAGNLRSVRAKLRPITQARATAWLSALASDLAAGPPSYFFPIALAMRLLRHGGDPEGQARGVRTDTIRQSRSGEGVPELVPGVHQLPAPSRDEVGRLLERRYALLDDLWEGPPW